MHGVASGDSLSWAWPHSQGRAEPFLPRKACVLCGVLYALRHTAHSSAAACACTERCTQPAVCRSPGSCSSDGMALTRHAACHACPCTATEHWPPACSTPPTCVAAMCAPCMAGAGGGGVYIYMYIYMGARAIVLIWVVITTGCQQKHCDPRAHPCTPAGLRAAHGGHIACTVEGATLPCMHARGGSRHTRCGVLARCASCGRMGRQAPTRIPIRRPSRPHTLPHPSMHG